MTTQHALEDQPISVKVKLAAAWTSFMFFYVYVDVIGFYKPGVVTGILEGKMWEFEVTESLLATGLGLLAIPIFMILLSVALPARASRIANLVVASIQVPFAAFNLAGEAYFLYYGTGLALELVVLVYILRTAWTWPRGRFAN